MEEKSALLVIDMQNDFLDPRGPFGDRDPEGLPPELTDMVCRVIRRARDRNMPVIHVYQEHRRQLVDFGRELDRSRVHCVEGTRGARIVDEIEVRPEDFLVVKRRFSGFLHTDLELLLKGLGTDTLYFCGIAADGCVRATAADAHQLNYRIRLIPEAVAGLTRESARAALEYLATLQPDVLVPLECF